MRRYRKSSRLTECPLPRARRSSSVRSCSPNRRGTRESCAKRESKPIESLLVTKERSMRRVFGTIAILSAFTFSTLHAQSWPSKPIRLLVPFVPGGNVDITARAVAPGLQEILGQPVIVENRPGAGGTIAANQVAKAFPDGYTLLMGSTSTLGVAPALYKA